MLGDVRASFTYAVPPQDKAGCYYRAKQGAPAAEINFTHRNHETVVRDMRAAPELCTLSRAGFQLSSLPAPDIEWTDEVQVKEKFLPCAEEVIKRTTGASRVHFFDYTFRKGVAKHSDEQLKDTKIIGSSEVRPPLPRVHADFTEASAPMRLQKALPDEAEQLSQARYAIIQLWRPMNGPVIESPLALFDARSIDADDLMEMRMELPEEDPRTRVTGTGNAASIYISKHNARHRPYFVSNMRSDEVLLFKGYDSKADEPKFVPHASFRLPDASDDTVPRESMELRAFAFWD